MNGYFMSSSTLYSKKLHIALLIIMFPITVTLFAVWLFVLKKTITATFLNDNECQFYLAPSRIPGAGRGVFTGVSLRDKEFLDEGQSLLIYASDVRDTQLEEYVFATNDDEYSMVIFGVSSLFNSANKKNVYYHWAKNELKIPQDLAFLPYTNFTETIFHTLRDIEPHEELLSNYGEDWFELRHASSNVDSIIPIETSVEPDQKVCVSNVKVDISTIPDIGDGLFAAKDFKVGELVSISPTLVLPKFKVDMSQPTSQLKNYCIGLENIPIVLFPIGNTAMLNHHTTNANVKMEWFSWKKDGTAPKILESDITKLASGGVAPLDVAYRATREIRAGEELFLDYGPEWNQAWLQHNSCFVTSFFDLISDPICYLNESPFRSLITPSHDLFPLHWINSKFVFRPRYESE